MNRRARRGLVPAVGANEDFPTTVDVPLVEPQRIAEPTLSSLPGWRPLLEAVPQAVVAPLAPLQEWATCLSSALTHRWRLSSDDVRTLAAPFRQDLPLLERRLNEPV